jgi:hypothetical protein
VKVKRAVIAQRGFRDLGLDQEHVAEIDYRPGNRQLTYRLVMLRKWIKGRTASIGAAVSARLMKRLALRRPRRKRLGQMNLCFFLICTLFLFRIDKEY